MELARELDMIQTLNITMENLIDMAIIKAS